MIIHFRMTLLNVFITKVHALKHKQTVTKVSWVPEVYNCTRVTKIGSSTIGQRIDYNEVGDLRSQLHIPSKN